MLWPRESMTCDFPLWRLHLGLPLGDERLVLGIERRQDLRVLGFEFAIEQWLVGQLRRDMYVGAPHMDEPGGALAERDAFKAMLGSDLKAATIRLGCEHVDDLAVAQAANNRRGVSSGQHRNGPRLVLF